MCVCLCAHTYKGLLLALHKYVWVCVGEKSYVLGGDFLEVEPSGRYIQLWFFQVSLHEPCTFTTRAFQRCDRILDFQGLCEACSNAWAHERHRDTRTDSDGLCRTVHS